MRAGGLVGLLRVLGVLLHRRGDFLHRGRGLLQARRLLLGALRQVGRAGGNLRRGVGDFARRRLDLADGRADPLRHRVGVVLQLAEHALVFGSDALGQVAAGERAQHADKIVQRLADVLAQRVHRGGEIEHEVLLAFERNTLREVAGHRGLDQAVDLGLDCLLDGLVPPFDDRAGALAVLIHDRRGHQVEFLAADRDVALVGTGEQIEQPALMGWVLVEHVHVGAEQLAGVEIRQHLAQLGLGLMHHLLQGRVHVDDVVVVVGDHHIRADDVERRSAPAD